MKIATVKSPVEIAYEKLEERIFTSLVPFRFKRRRSTAILKGNDACGIVEFQRSMRSLRTNLIFTLNVGVVFGKLVDPRDYERAMTRPSAMFAQIRERIGTLVPGGQDKWWEITEFTDTNSLGDELSSLVFNHAVPFIQNYLQIENVIALWQRGQSPGLTDGERQAYLARVYPQNNG